MSSTAFRLACQPFSIPIKKAFLTVVRKAFKDCLRESREDRLLHNNFSAHMQMLVRAPHRAEKRESASFISQEFNFFDLAGLDLVYGRLDMKVGQGKAMADGLNIADTNPHLLAKRNRKLTGIPVAVKRGAGSQLYSIIALGAAFLISEYADYRANSCQKHQYYRE